MREQRRKDRRIRRTESLLRGALAALVTEKPYEEIAVKEILHRANVGRSTFYTHFGDKDDLLLSCIDDMLRAGQPGRYAVTAYEHLLGFGLPIYEHIERHRQGGSAAIGAGSREVMHDHLERAIVELLEVDVRPTLQHGRHANISAELLAEWIAATFVLVLNWWLESESPIPAREAHAIFRALVEPALPAALAPG